MSSNNADSHAGLRQEVEAQRDAYTADRDQTFINVTVGGEHPRAHRGQRGSAGEPIVVGDIPQEPLGFQSRSGLLAELDAAGPGISVVQAVTGMRGVGKTQLAAAYARAKLAAGWRMVAWVNTADTGSLLAGLAAVAEAVGIAGEVGSDAGLTVRHLLEVDGDSRLIVFDNAADADVLRSYLPAGGAARVLITSNRQSVANLGFRVGVEVFTPDEARAFLSDRTGLVDHTGAETVAEELGYLPLALAQAAAVIAGQQLGYGTYLERLRSLPVEDYLTREPGQPYPRGVAEAVLLSLNEVQTDDQGGVRAGVLEIMSVLSAAGVRRDLLYAAPQVSALGMGQSGAGVAEVTVDTALGQLAERSLLSFSLEGKALIAHRLVLRVVRDQLAKQGRLAAACRAAASVLVSRSRALAQSQDRLAVRDVPEQVLALQEVAAEVSGKPDPQLGTTLLELRFWAMYHLNALGDSAQQAILIGEPLLTDCERMLGPDSRNTQAVRSGLASAYREVGRVAEAITLDKQALAAFTQGLGLDHPDTLSSQMHLAADYQRAGRPAEAIPLHEHALAGRQRVLGRDHPDTLMSRNNLANAYAEAGRVAEAIPLHEQTLADRERTLGANHPDTVQSRGNLGNAYKDAGRAAEAIRLLKRARADYEQILGADHPIAVRTRVNLAAAYQSAGPTTEAIPLLEQVLVDLERLAGPDHPEILAVREQLAQARSDQSTSTVE